jgi:hypothetical protein
MTPADTSHHFCLRCRRETPTHKRFLTEAHATLAEGLAAMLEYQQRRWQSVTLTPVVGPIRVLATGSTLRKVAR